MKQLGKILIFIIVVMIAIISYTQLSGQASMTGTMPPVE